jgi:uncharacterized protein involved in exopolysaccharide biosynthesis
MGVRPLIVGARYKLLLLVPFLVILPVAIALTFLSRTTEYSSTSSLWAERAAIINTPGDNTYISPAQNRVNDLHQLLSTDAFRLEVAERVNLRIDTTAQARASMAAISSGTFAYTSGEHLLIIGHTGPDPVMAQKIVQATIDEFVERYLARSADQAGAAIGVYESQQATDQETLTAAQLNLTEYLESAGPSAATTPRYTELKASVDRAQATLNDTTNKLESARKIRDQGPQALAYTLKTIDSASAPEAPEATTKRQLLALPIAGFLLALSLSAGLYAFLLKTDNSIRIAEDLNALPGLLLLGSVPDVAYLRRRSWPKNFFRVAVSSLGLH